MRISETEFQSKLRAAIKQCHAYDKFDREDGGLAPIDMGFEQVIESAIDALSASLRSGNQDCAYHSLAYMMQAIGKLEIEYPA